MGNAVFDWFVKPFLYDTVERAGPPFVVLLQLFAGVLAFFMMSAMFSAEDPDDMEPGSVPHAIFVVNPFHHQVDDTESEPVYCDDLEYDDDDIILLDILFGIPDFEEECVERPEAEETADDVKMEEEAEEYDQSTKQE